MYLNLVICSLGYNDPRVLLGCNRGSAVVIVLLDVIGKVGYK